MTGASGHSSAAGHGAQPLAFTRFIFIVGRDEGDAYQTRLRSAGSAIARGFFNAFDADGSREVQPPTEAIQFMVRSGEGYPDSMIAAARHAVQISGRYRPRLHEIEIELRRRLGDAAELFSLEGAERPPRYTSADLHDFAYKAASPRRPGRQAAHAIVLPLSKTDEWWAKPTLERHAYFYPHVDDSTGCPVPGHAVSAEEGIATLFRRLYHNPDGYGRKGEFDFITYFECEQDHLPAFDRVLRRLQDTSRNPEWRYVREGPQWRGRRVLKW